MSEREHCDAVAGSWIGEVAMSRRLYGHDILVSQLADLIERERAAAREDERRKVLEECAALCEQARPVGGRAWSEGQQGAFEALAHVADYIRALATKDGAK